MKSRVAIKRLTNNPTNHQSVISPDWAHMYDDVTVCCRASKLETGLRWDSVGGLTCPSWTKRGRCRTCKQCRPVRSRWCRPTRWTVRPIPRCFWRCWPGTRPSKVWNCCLLCCLSQQTPQIMSDLLSRYSDEWIDTFNFRFKINNFNISYKKCFN